MSDKLTKREFVALEILKALIAVQGKGSDNPRKKLSYAALEMADVLIIPEGETP